MELIRQFFATLASMTDAAILEALTMLEQNDLIASARLRAAIKKVEGLEFRRLKMALGYPVEPLALAVMNIPFMTDEELVVAFLKATPDQRAEFIVALDEVTDENGERGRKVLATVQERLNAEKAERIRREEEEAERIRREEEARARKYLLAHPEVVVTDEVSKVDDEVALAFIEQQPYGYFRTAADALSLVVMVEEQEMLRDMLTKELLTREQARVIRNCFVTNEEGAKRLVKKLPRREGKDKDRYFHFNATVDFLQQRDTERTERKLREDAFTDAVWAALEPAKSFEALAEAYGRLYEENLEGGQNAQVPDWKRRIMDGVADELEQGHNGIRFRFVGELRERFAKGSDIPALDEFIVELRADYQGTPEGVVRNAKFRKLGTATKHREWLQSHPEGVKQREDDGVIPIERARSRREESVGTHRFTRGTPGNAVFTKHDDPEGEEQRRRDRRNRDREHTQATRGKGGDGGGKKGQQKKAAGGKGRK